MNARRKANFAKYKVFASQHTPAFELFCKENGIPVSMQDYQVVQAFYAQKFTAKAVNAEIKSSRRAAKAARKHITKKTIAPSQIKYNKGFHLINGDCLVGQKPIRDKTQICEPEPLVIQ